MATAKQKVKAPPLIDPARSPMSTILSRIRCAEVTNDDRRYVYWQYQPPTNTEELVFAARLSSEGTYRANGHPVYICTLELAGSIIRTHPYVHVCGATREQAYERCAYLLSALYSTDQHVLVPDTIYQCVLSIGLLGSLARYQEAFSDLIERSHYRVHYGVAIGELPAIGGNIVSEEQFRDLEILYKNTSADVKELRSTVDRLNKQLSPQKVTDEVAALRKELREANAKVTKLELQVDSLVHGRDRAELREALRQEIFSEIEGASGFTREMLLTKSVPQPGHLEID